VGNVKRRSHDTNQLCRSISSKSYLNLTEDALRVIQDNLQRTTVESIIRHERIRLESLIQYSSLAIVTLDEKHNVVSCNPQFEEMFQFKESEIRGKNLDEIVVSAAYTGSAISYTSRVLKGEAVHGSSRRKRKDGKLIDVEFFGVPVIVDNEILGIYAIYRDITAEKRARQALQESEARYRNLFEGVPVALYRTSPSGRILQANPALVQLLGYPNLQTLLEVNAEEIEDPEERKRMLALLMETGEIRDFETQLRRYDGTLIWVQDTARAVHDAEGRLLHYEGSLVDVTERKSARLALHESEKKYRDLFDTISDFIYTHDLEGHFVTVNRAAAETLGYIPKDLIGRPISDFMFPEYRHAFYEEYLPRIKRDGALDGITKYLAHDGSTHYIEYRSVLVNQNGRNPVVSGSGRNITDRILAQREVSRLEQQLQQAQKMEAIGTLAGGVAHDFNNILAAIIGYTELAGLQLADDHKAIGSLKEVLKAGHRAKDLVKQILSFSRQSQQELRPVDITPIVKEALKLLRASLPATIDIKQNIESTMGTVQADPTQIHQVLMNLCTNAAHAMRREGGTLEVTIKKMDVDTIAAREYADLHPGPYLRLTVKDTGHGIPSDILQRIFEPYFSTKGRDQSTGLGLAVVHGIVKSHRGIVLVESEPGQGTTFHVYLPLINGTTYTQRMPASEALPTGTESILFVDDEGVLVDIGKKMLEHLGYEVVTRTSSIEALEMFRTNPDRFELVITDMTMPNMTGETLAKEIMKIRNDMPIILCTGFSERISEEKAKALGIRKFLMKPLVLREFAKTIREALDTK